MVEKAQALSLCKASVFFGAQVLRGRETRSDGQGERSSGSNERRSVERTSVFVERTSLRGAMREPEVSAVVRLTFAWSDSPGASETRVRFRLA